MPGSPDPHNLAAAPPGRLGRIKPPHPVAAQFIKFCVVGVSSTVISLGVLNFLLYVLHFQAWLNASLAGVPVVQHFVTAHFLYLQVAGIPGFVLGVTNGFFWNAKWTFPQADALARHQQYFRFFAVNIGGLMVNWLVQLCISLLLAHGRPDLTTMQEQIAIIGAIVITSVWNFTGNKLWTFK
jgi:putative flippase GtrA